jgi:hypothetical protein
MYVSMICTYTHINIHVNICINTCICTYIYIHTQKYMHIYTISRVCAKQNASKEVCMPQNLRIMCVWERVSECVCLHVCVCVRARARAINTQPPAPPALPSPLPHTHTQAPWVSFNGTTSFCEISFSCLIQILKKSMPYYICNIKSLSYEEEDTCMPVTWYTCYTKSMPYYYLLRYKVTM